VDPGHPARRFPARQFVLSIDAYLNKPYDDTPAGYADHTMRFLDPKLEYADKNGLQVAFSEWAITAVDQPGNVRRHLETFEGLHKAGKLAPRALFRQHPGTRVFGKTQLPRSSAAYVDWWKGRA
jgi:hypothetical protein